MAAITLPRPAATADYGAATRHRLAGFLIAMRASSFSTSTGVARSPAALEPLEDRALQPVAVERQRD